MVDVKEYFEQARIHLEERDYRKFLENISIARFLAEDDSAIKLEILYLYANGLYEFADNQTALEVVDEIIPFFEGEKRYRLLNAKGVILGKMGKLDKAIEIFEEILALDRYPMVRLKVINSLAWAYVYQSNVLSDSGLLDLAIEVCHEGQKLFTKVDDYLSKQKLLMNLGTAYWYKGSYEKSKEAFFKALSNNKNDPTLLNNLAFTYLKLDDLDKAYEYLNHAERIAEEYSNHYERAKTYYIRALIAEREGDYTQAIDYYIIAIDLFDEAQASIDSYECTEKVDKLMLKIKHETSLLKRRNLKKHSLPEMGKHYSFT